MDSKIFILTFCVILAVINFQPTNAEDEAAYTAYRDYEAELDGKTTIDEKVAYLIFDLRKAAAIMRVGSEFLAKNPTGLTAAQKAALNQLNFNLGQAAITSMVENLVNAINIETRPLPADTITTVHNLIINYENHPDIAYKIFEAAIDQMFRRRSLLQLAEILRASEAKDDKIDVFLFNIQLYLFNKYEPYYSSNNEYVLYIAYYLYEVKTLQIINLRYDETYKLDKAIETLPSTLKSLFFSKGVCFKNYESYEYLYEDTGTALNRSRRYVYTRQSDSSITTSGIFTTSFSISMATIESTLRNKLYKHYVYRGNDDIIYANTSPIRVPRNSLWSLSFNRDRIRFNQDGYYLCGSEKLRNGNRRYVEAEKYLPALVPRLCEWYVDDCQNIN